MAIEASSSAKSFGRLRARTSSTAKGFPESGVELVSPAAISSRDGTFGFSGTTAGLTAVTSTIAGAFSSTGFASTTGLAFTVVFLFAGFFAAGFFAGDFFVA